MTCGPVSPPILTEARAARGPRRHGGRYAALVGLCAGACLVEVATLAATGRSSTLPLAPQVAAPLPYAVFHDLRWLLVFHRSWAWFTAEALALVVVRSLVTAGCAWLAWPGDPPPARGLLLRSAAATCTLALLLAPLAALTVGMAVAPVSYVILAGLPMLTASLLLTGHSAAVPWWRVAPSRRAVAWSLATLAVLSAASGVIAAVPPWAAVPLAGLVGVFDAAAWRGTLRACARGRQPVVRGPRPRWRRWTRWTVPVVLAVVLAASLGGIRAFVGTHVLFGVPDLAYLSYPPPLGRPVLVVGGFGSDWPDQRVLRFGPAFDVRHFSYEGLTPDGRPLPYDGYDTNKPLGLLAAMLRRQVEALHQRTGQEVVLVGQSEGTLVASRYLDTVPRAPVTTFVMVSPVIGAARAYFPPAGSDGFGVATGWVLRAVMAGFGRAGDVGISPDAPLLRSLDDSARARRDPVCHARPGIRQFAVLPLADAVAGPYKDSSATRTCVPTAVVVAGMHGQLMRGARAQDLVGDYLAGDTPESPVPTFVWSGLRAITSGWQAPTLPLHLNPAWRDERPSAVPH